MSYRKDKDTFTYKWIDVGEDYEFETLKLAIDWLSVPGQMSGNTALILTNDEVIDETIVIDLDFDLVIRSEGYGLVTLTPSLSLSGNSMFDIRSNLGIDQTTNGANIRQPFSTPVYLDDVDVNDYFSIYIRNISGTQSVTLRSLNAYVDSR